MNQSSPKSRLEARLRDHYRRRADELTLGSMSWDDVVDRPRSVAFPGGSGRGRLLVAASVVVLVGGATAGVLAMRSGDSGSGQVAGGPTSAAGEALAPSTESLAASVPLTTTASVGGTTDVPLSSDVLVAELPDPDHPFLPCPADVSLPADAASTVFPNDVRFDGIPLPEATPDGYCILDHQAGAGLDGLSLYTVWASCADCAQPTAVIALIRSPIPVTDDPSHVSNDPSQAPGAIAVPMGGGRGGFFVPPSELSAISTLYTTDPGGATVVLAGWGLEQDDFIAFADAATTTGAALLGRLVQVYDDPLSEFFTTTIPTNHNFHVAYAHRGADSSCVATVKALSTCSLSAPTGRRRSSPAMHATTASSPGRRSQRTARRCSSTCTTLARRSPSAVRGMVQQPPTSAASTVPATTAP